MMLNIPGRHSQNEGFTLVEIAIVLVIIGLIIGGVLVGQDMIKSAEIRAAVSQLEKYNAATNTFREKYRQLPGDIGLTLAAQMGLPTRPAGSGTAGQYDQNGRLEGCNSLYTNMYIGCETVAYWSDLSAARLIDDSFVQPNTLSNPSITDSNDMPKYLPASKMGAGNYIMVFGAEGFNMFQLVGISTVNSGNPANPQARITAQQAFMVDSKIDDGKPNTGSVRARRPAPVSGYWVPYMAADAGTCVDTTATNASYVTTNPVEACSISARIN